MSYRTFTLSILSVGFILFVWMIFDLNIKKKEHIISMDKLQENNKNISNSIEISLDNIGNMLDNTPTKYEVKLMLENEKLRRNLKACEAK